MSRPLSIFRFSILFPFALVVALTAARPSDGETTQTGIEAETDTGTEALVVALHEHPPWATRLANGGSTGILVELWRTWAANQSREVRFLLGDLETSVRYVREGRADLHGGLPAFPDTLGGLVFGRAVALEPLALFFRPDAPVHAPGDLVGRRRAVPAWLEPADPWRHFDSPVALYASTRDALDALADDRVDHVVAPRLTAGEVLGTRRESFGSLPLQSPRLYLAARAENAARLDSIGRDLAALGPRARSLDGPYTSSETGPLLLPPGPTPSRDELSWLSRHPSVLLGATPWPPLSVLENGRYTGLAIETTRAIFAKVGVMPIFLGDDPWTEVVRRAEEGEYDGLGYSVTRPEPTRLVNTRSFLVPAFVLVNRADGPFLRDLDDLAGRTLAVKESYGVIGSLPTEHPDIEVIEVRRGEDGLRAVARGEADAFLDVLPAATRLVEQMRQQVEPLKLAARLDLTSPMGISIREDWPELIALLDRSIGETSENELAAIHATWDRVHFDPEPNHRAIWRAAILLASPLALLCAALVLRNFRHRRVARQEQERLREHLWQLRKLEAIGTLAGGVAHDFNNVLAAVLGHAELGRLHLGPGHAARDSFESIENAAHRGRDLVGHLLTFSQRQRVAQRPIDLVHLLDGLRTLLRSNLPANVELRVSHEVDEAWVAGDAAQLQRAFLHLIDNGAQAMPDGGRVVIELDAAAEGEALEVAMGTLEPRRHWRVRVRDHGVGIDPEILPRLFDPFFTTRNKAKSTGLGLSVVHGLVAAHGGGIRVESRPGQGACFELFLPVIAPPRELSGSTTGSSAGFAAPRDATPPPEPPKKVGQSRRILLVDDEDFLRDALSEWLQKLDFDVVSRRDGREALDAFLEAPERFDLVLTDLTMPAMSGAALADELAQRRPELPIVMMTGYTGDVVERQVREGVVREVVNKPMALRHLAEVLERHLASRSES